MSNTSTNPVTLDQVEERIEAIQDFITNNGSMYTASIAYPKEDDESTPEPIRFDVRAFEELSALYKAANRILYRQLLSLKALRTEMDFEGRADSFLEQIREAAEKELFTDEAKED